MNFLARFLHRCKARHYSRLAAQMQRDLTEYVLLEENRITIYLHRAGWHFARSKPQGSLPPSVTGHTTILPPAGLNGHLPSSNPQTAFTGRIESHRLDDKAPP